MAITPEQARAELERRQAQIETESITPEPVTTGAVPTLSPEQAQAELDRRQPPVSQISSRPLEPHELQSIEVGEFLQDQIQRGNIEPEDPSLFQRIVQELPQTVGGMAGAAATIRAMQPRIQSLPPNLKAPATLGAGVVGSMVGGFAGKAGQLGYIQSETGEPIEFRDIVEQSSIAALEEGAGEVVGFGIGKLLGKGVKFVKGAKEAAEIAELGGTVATRGQLTTGRIARTMERFAEGFLFGGGKLRTVKELAQSAAIAKRGQAIIESFASHVGKNVTPTQGGQALRAALWEADEYFHAASKGLYKQVQKQMKREGVKNLNIVSMQPLKKFAESLLTDPASLTKYPPAIQTQLKNIAKLPDAMSLNGAASVRTAFFNHGKTAMLGGDTAAEGVMKQLLKRTHEAIEVAGNNLPPTSSVMEAWKNANAFYAQGKDKFGQAIIKKLSKSLQDKPEDLVRVLFKEEGVTNVLRAKNVLSMQQGLNEKAWGKVKDSLVQSIFDTARKTTADPEVFTFSGKMINDQLDKLGPDVLKATFKPEEVKLLRGFALGAGVLQEKFKTKSGEIIASILQAGTVRQATKGDVGAAILTLGIPKYMSKIATNPKWSAIAQGALQPHAKPAALAKFAIMANRVMKEVDTKERTDKLDALATTSPELFR